MYLLAAIFIFSLGLSIGSFLNVLIYRFPRNESVVATRSYCPDCKKELRWFELIPLLSFIWQGGKCRSCQNRISWQYPVVEFITGTLFVFTFYLIFSLSSLAFSRIANAEFLISKLFDLGYLWFVVSVLIVVFVTDLRYYIIPDKVVFPAIAVALLYNLFRNWDSSFGFRLSDLRSLATDSFWGPLIAGFFVSFFFLSLVVVSHGRWMGMGDVKFAFLMGLLLGFPKIFVALFLAFLFGTIVGILLIAAKKKTMQSQLPFGTFLTLATFLGLFWGDPIFNWYWNSFL